MEAGIGQNDLEFRARRGEEVRTHRTTLIARGRIEIEYFGEEDLTRIAGVLLGDA